MPVGGERPHTDEREQQHELLEKRVVCPIGDEDGVHRVSKAGRCEIRDGFGSERRRRVGQRQDAERERRRDGSAENRRKDALQCAGPAGGGLRFGLAQASGSADEQCSRHAAADRRFRQRHIDCGKAHPHEREQHSEGNECDDG